MKDTEQQALAYRRLFGRFATGVAVVLAQDGEKTIGMTVNSLTSTSLNPLLLLFCVRNESRSGVAILRTGRFTVNILTAQQETAARHFAGQVSAPAVIAEDFKLVHGEPFVWLANANAVFRCELEALHPGGDHRIVLARVIDQHGPEECERMLIYHEGNYAQLSPRCSEEAVRP